MKSKVYFTKEISPESLINIYKALGRELKGRVAVKISSGEPGGHNFLAPSLIKPLVDMLRGTIVECNTAYEGKRSDTADHEKALIDHGYTAIAPCDIMDSEGDMAIPLEGGRHLKENYVGKHFVNYDSMLMLSHFKGHLMGGFGGALKNMSIGVASAKGKGFIHGAGKPEEIWSADHDSFLESMAEADKAVMDSLGRENLLYINVANNLSVDCDCDSNPAKPEMADIGIFASTDPVAVDCACVDAVYASPDPARRLLSKE